ncbi:hypothetical protein ACU61A_00695 [Pseudonocardia sichuanensis]
MPLAHGGGTGRRVFALMMGITVFALVLREPVGAADAVERALAWAGDALDSLVQFAAALSDE